jgi:uncharacterized protein (TIGR02246 family)
MKATSADRRDFLTYPTNRVVGTVTDAGKAREAIDALLRAGFRDEDIDLLHGEEGLHRLDQTGAEHGFLAQFQRTMIRTFETNEFQHLTHHVEDIRAGRCVIMVLTKRREQRIVAGDILHQHGAEFVGFYGRWAWADVPPSHHMTPADVPAAFVRAWNARDPNAIASLFDGDAEFVNGTGAYWHGREAIRQGHQSRLQGVADTMVLSTGETHVKLLLPEVAVVHARMTSGGEAPAGAGTPGTGTTIASFVVHRVGERWLIASMHNTDVAPNLDTDVISETGVLGSTP